MIEGQELGAHTGLVAEEVSFLHSKLEQISSMNENYHAIHKLHEAPECNGVVLHDCIYRSQQITHALHISQVSVILVIC